MNCRPNLKLKDVCFACRLHINTCLWVAEQPGLVARLVQYNSEREQLMYEKEISSNMYSFTAAIGTSYASYDVWVDWRHRHHSRGVDPSFSAEGRDAGADVRVDNSLQRHL